MKILPTQNYIILKFFIFILFHIHFSISIEECDIDFPIFKDGTCQLTNCTDDEFKNETCIIKNEIMKTQWITDIKNYAEIANQYSNIILTESGDLISIISAYPETTVRYFFGIKKNGRAYFSDNKMTHEISISCTASGTGSCGRFESILFETIIGGQSYFVSIGKTPQNLEIYDLKNDKSYYISLSNLFSEIINNFVNTIIKIDNTTFIYGYIATNFSYTTQINFYLSKLDFSNFNINNNNPPTNTNKKNFLSADAKIVSCFKTDNKIIICFYETNGNKYRIVVFDINVNQLNTQLDFDANGRDVSDFYKCTHFIGEAGAFAYFSGDYVVIYFKKYNSSNQNINNYFSSDNIVYLSGAKFSSNCLSNDIIKITDKKLAYAAISSDSDKIYIIIIHNYEEENISVGYYVTLIEKLVNIDLYINIKIVAYNQLIAIAFGSESGKKGGYTAIFSYPNTEDVDFDVIDYLTNNNMTIENLEISLKNYSKIENNIFGYIYSGIQITKLCDGNISFVSSKTNTEITENYILEEDENILLDISSETIQAAFCRLEYLFTVTEPEFNIYKKYQRISNFTIGGEPTSFTRNKYTGKISYINIYISENLKINCSENCILCLEKNNLMCISCVDNYVWDYIDSKKIKNKNSFCII